MKPHQHPTFQTKLWAIIPAAGSGSRFSKTELKQYQLIDGKTVLEHTVDRLNGLPLDGYVLAIGQDDNIAQTLPLKNRHKAHFCLGGKERADSVLNALNHLLRFASEDDYVLVHDAARPCVSLPNLEALMTHCTAHDVHAILATPVRDTLKQVQQQPKIEKTVDRSFLWQAQTPQMAKLGILKRCIEYALMNQIPITDEASALEYMGETVDVVQGRSDNIKITYSEDLQLARLILNAQRQS